MMDESLQRAMKLSNEQKILLRLIHGELVTKADLMDLIYGDDPDGGPVYAEQCLTQAIHALRDRLRLEGWDIELVKCYGLEVGKGRTFQGCPETERERRSQRISGRTGADWSRPGNYSARPDAGRSAPSRSPSPAHGLTDFLSKPSQHIGS
jgi:hypothetical protein